MRLAPQIKEKREKIRDIVSPDGDGFSCGLRRLRDFLGRRFCGLERYKHQSRFFGERYKGEFWAEYRIAYTIIELLHHFTERKNGVMV